MKKPKLIKTHFLTFPSIILSDDRLLPTDLILLSLMILYDNEKGCFAQNKSLADITHCSVGTVSKSIKKLILLGYVLSNSLDAERGGRGRIRRVRSDLKIHKADTSKKVSSHEEKSSLPSKKDSHIYKGDKKKSKEIKFSIEIEKKLVQELLSNSFPNKWEFYKSCKKQYAENHLISWNEREVTSLISLINKLYETFIDKLKSLPFNEQANTLVQIFEIIIRSKPNFFYDTLPSTYNRFWNSVIQEEKVKNSLSKFFMRYQGECHF